MKKIKLQNNKIKKDLTQAERYFGVLLESMDSKIDILVDGHKNLNEKIGRVEENLGEFRREVDYKFEVVFDELLLIRNEFKEKVGRDEFLVLEKRVAVLEKTRK